MAPLAVKNAPQVEISFWAIVAVTVGASGVVHTPVVGLVRQMLAVNGSDGVEGRTRAVRLPAAPILIDEITNTSVLLGAAVRK